jgi:alginate O-acetyltransferase complex protein AlgI
MAIGLALMFGFKIKENFNYPLIATSITDFWRRWHISLSSWFKDYIYIPLGGNKVKTTKWIRNIVIVWLLTGFWHGAIYNFIIWGIYFGLLLIIEKKFIKKYLHKTKVTKYIYTSIIIIISFLIFNTTELNELTINLKNMFFINKIPLINNEILFHLRNNIILIIISILAATPIPKYIINKPKTTKLNKLINVLEPITYILLLILTTAFLLDESFNPFLYFRF